MTAAQEAGRKFEICWWLMWALISFGSAFHVRHTHPLATLPFGIAGMIALLQILRTAPPNPPTTEEK